MIQTTVMTYKLKSDFKIKFFVITIISLCISHLCFADDEKSWNVSAVEFSYTQEKKRSQSEIAVLSAMPKLILDQLYGLKERNVPDSEILDRQLNTLLKDRLSLFLELSKEVKVRDSLVLQNISEYQFDKQVNASEKKIKEISLKLDKNLEEQEKILKNSTLKKHDSEVFSIYKNDSEKLFECTKTDYKNDYQSYQFSSEVVDANINGIITGTIVTYSSYAAVSVELLTYPGASKTGVITEVGSLSNIEGLAKNIAYRLIPKIENAVPCEVQIKISDAKLAEKARLIVDSTVYSPVPEKIILSSGVHNITFECEGFRRESFSYGFGYEKKYLMEVEFVPEVDIKTGLILKNNIQGDFFYNGKRTDDNVVSVKINNLGVLGYYYTENDNTLFFMIPKNNLAADTAMELNLKDIDIGANIDKRRKMMYISYSALICSLPFLFYSYSNYNNLYRGYSLRYSNIDVNEIKTYQTMSFIGIGLSCGLGAWFVFELVRYLVAANKTLPVEARKSKHTFDESVSGYEQMKLMFKALEEEELARKKIEEASIETEASEKTTDNKDLQIEEKQ